MTIPPIPTISTEPISTLVQADQDPTDHDVVFALVALPDGADPEATPPADDAWKAGEWTGDAHLQADRRWQARAKVEVGPGTELQQTAGTFAAWVRVLTDGDKGPTRCFDVVTFT